jgi:hypothetical protein
MRETLRGTLAGGVLVGIIAFCLSFPEECNGSVMTTGFVHFEQLGAEHQKEVFAHCSTDEKISKVVDTCLDDPFNRPCWKYQHVMCLETWR